MWGFFESRLKVVADVKCMEVLLHLVETMCEAGDKEVNKLFI